MNDFAADSKSPAFPATNWNWVAALQGAQSPGGESAKDALALLCAGYWYPIYAFLRSKGHTPHEAEDLAQGFFERLLRYDSFASARPEKGRLRNYLLTSLQHFVIGQYQSSQAKKRGQGVTHLPIHLAWAEERFGGENQEPADDSTAERTFNRRWWALIIEQALARVRDSYATRGDLELFHGLSPLLDEGRAAAGSYEKLAQQLQVSEQALRVGLVRLKRRVAEAVRNVVKETVGDDAAVDDELAAMMTGR
jgi:DNA-directed RNA polymerase specialized sigma24 family protein